MFVMRWGATGLALLGLLAGCAAAGGGTDLSAAAIDDVLGVYQGSFGTALTDDPADDLNYNPCDPARERCLGGDEPLVDIVLELRRDPQGRVWLAFFRSPADRDRGAELDLLGRGCGTGIGPLDRLDRAEGSDHRIAVFPLTADTRLCLNKLRPTSEHELKLELGRDPATGASFAQVLIDREVTSGNYLYVEEDGVRRKVRIDLDNTVVSGPERRYRVCIEDELGEFDRCVLTDRELKRFLLPVPVPGGAAVSYTWWYNLTPKLERTKGLYQLEQYVGRFDRVTAPPAAH